MRPLALFCILFFCASCDSDSPPVIDTTTQPSTHPAAPRVRAERVAPLPAGRLTHLAPDGASRLFWIQESEQSAARGAQPGQQVLFSMSDGGLPTTARITNATILAALGRESAPGATGQIQSLVFGADGQLYFYFAGGTRREILSAFGSFTPGSDQIRILADTSRLKSDSAMGDSLGLARGTLMRSGDLIWLWLRHQDGYALLLYDIRRSASGLKRPFERLTGPAARLLLTSSGEDLSSAGGTLFYLDRPGAKIWRIDPQGLSTLAADVADLPASMTAPLGDSRGRLITFASSGRPFNGADPTDDVAAMLAQNKPAAQIHYPALLFIDGASHTTISHDQWDTPPGLVLSNFSTPRLFIDRGRLLAYDPATGELIRLRMD